jgi:hypothetical protein
MLSSRSSENVNKIKQSKDNKMSQPRISGSYKNEYIRFVRLESPAQHSEEELLQSCPVRTDLHHDLQSTMEARNHESN